MIGRHETLTGRRRHIVRSVVSGYWIFQRRTTFLVLQVERTYLATWWSAGTIDSDWITDWRDARVGDLTVEGT